MARARVKVVSETSTGLNNKVSINGVVYTNTQAYNKAVRGEVNGYHGVKNSVCHKHTFGLISAFGTNLTFK